MIKKRVLLISTGGTICSKNDDNIHLDKPFKALDMLDENLAKSVDITAVSPFTILSEQMDFEHIKTLIDTIYDKSDDFDGVIILHGSDTLAFTSAIISNIFYDKNIVLTASDKPIEDKSSNAIPNFNNAVSHIIKSKSGVFVSYDGIYNAQTVTSADGLDKFRCTGKVQKNIANPQFSKKNILIIKPYINNDYNNYNLDGVYAIIHEMYHCATVSDSAKEFMKKCESKNIKFYFVTPKSTAQYDSAKDIKDKIIYDITTENAYARLLVDNDK